MLVSRWPDYFWRMNSIVDQATQNACRALWITEYGQPFQSYSFDNQNHGIQYQNIQLAITRLLLLALGIFEVYQYRKHKVSTPNIDVLDA